jgi:hypothetical protein
LEDTTLENFTQLGYDVNFDELVELAEAILDPIPELQQQCGGTFESSAVESPELISKSKWGGPIHVWPRWPSVTMEKKKDNELFQTRVQKDDFHSPFID